MRTADGDRIHQLLRQCVGRDNAITARQIASALQMVERDVRFTIASEWPHWVENGQVLVSVPAINGGFFYANEAEQIQRRERLLISLWLEAGFKVLQFQEAARSAGFGGLLLGWTAKIIRFIQGKPEFKTFVEESHPERRKEAA